MIDIDLVKKVRGYTEESEKNGFEVLTVPLRDLFPLLGRVETAERERDDLRAEIARRDAAAGEPVAVLYRNGDVLTKAECGEYFETCCKVETPLYTAPPASSVPDVNFDLSKSGTEATVITHYQVPDGWKLVPLKAFPSQWAAGQKAFDAAGINKIDPVYHAMVEAAPAPGGERGDQS